VTREGTFKAAQFRLPELASLGINTLQLMPLGAFPGEHNWSRFHTSPATRQIPSATTATSARAGTTRQREALGNPCEGHLGGPGSHRLLSGGVRPSRFSPVLDRVAQDTHPLDLHFEDIPRLHENRRLARRPNATSDFIAYIIFMRLVSIPGSS
jgi:hypothetical protein